MKVFLSVVSLLLMLITPVYSASPPDTDTIPAVLEPWKPWVLHGEEAQFCPTSYNNGEVHRCVWPSVLDLDLDSRSGRFTQQWLVFVKDWVPLPGGNKHWPLNVKVNGKTVSVVLKADMPSVYMTAGTHRVEGSFVWTELPEMIQIPNASGLVNLSINGKAVDFPLLDNLGRLWLQKRTDAEVRETQTEIRIYRLLNDTIPMRATTHLKINVSGRAGEISVDGALLEGFTPLNINSPIPAGFGVEGKLFIQARPGQWEIRVLSRSDGPVNAVKTADLAYGEEIWAFQSQNHLRIVEIEGVSAIDPTQTNIPNEWKRYPAFIVKAGDQMRLKELRRGDPDPAPDRIHLKRTWWLDFNGGGFTIQDRINGDMSRQWHLVMNPPTVLGRVTVDGKDQLITRPGEGENPGVELRRGRLDLVSESRFDASIKDLPAVGWDHDFQSVSGTLNLPPGWRLLTAAGVDIIRGTWFSQWTLLDLFLVLIISLSVTKLWNWQWGILALAAVGLTYHEPGAPRMVWLHLIAATALLRFIPQGWMRKLVNIWILASFVTLVALAIPFMVQQVRWGVYPQLEPRGPQVEPRGAGHLLGGGRYAMEEMSPQDRPDVGTPALPSAPEKGKVEFKKRFSTDLNTLEVKQDDVKRRALMVQDPNALIQTGPGLPDWQWRSYPMTWNGPVERFQQVRLRLLSPHVNLVLAFVRIIFLALLIFRITSFRKWRLPQGTFTFSAIFVCMLLIPGMAAAQTMSGDYPSAEILKELKERLLEKPDCLPDCAGSPQMKLTLGHNKLNILFKVHAAVETAIPLPGSLDTWRPTLVRMDSRPASGLMRDKDGSLWILIPKGIHTVTLMGTPPEGNSFQILLPLKPQQVIVESDGWDVQGVTEEGRVEGGIQLIRQQEEAAYSIQPSRTLPPFLHVERVLSLGLTWQVQTTIRRITSPGTPVVVSIPLISGESVTTGGVHVEDGKVHLNMGPDEKETRWQSTLKTENVIKLRAPQSGPWTETWLLDASPIWHCVLTGIPVVHHQDKFGQRQPQWKPWPGEEVTIAVSRPMAIPGQVATIDHAKLTLTPGGRFDNVDLFLRLRSSQGGQHKIVLPEDARLQWVKIGGKTQPIREKDRELIVPLRPGSQTVELQWHESTGSSILTRAPKVHMGEQAVNADVLFKMPRNRWILLTHGPDMGPAVLFWSYLIVIIIGAIALGRIAWTPLRTFHWVLLGLGLTQTHPLWAILIVGWLLCLGLRKEYSFSESWFSFNGSQVVLAIWTIAALIGLYLAIQKGLLGIPNMQIAGNDSSDFLLRWTQDRIGSLMPMPMVFSLPLFVFRIFMLLWALWLAYSLLKWLRWGWQCFSEGGLWRKIPIGKGKKGKAVTAPVSSPGGSESG